MNIKLVEAITGGISFLDEDYRSKSMGFRQMDIQLGIVKFE